MTCNGCATENRPGRRFCSKCGASLAVACPACGFTNEPGDEFCGGCGQRLGAPGEPVRAAAPAPRRPLMLLVEDLRRVDASSLELLSLLVEQVATARICVLLTAALSIAPATGAHTQRQGR